MGSIFIQIFVVAFERCMRFETECVTAHRRSSKVVDFDTNRKHVYDFLLIIDTNLGPRFRDIAGFLLKTASHPYMYFTRFLGVFPLD